MGFHFGKKTKYAACEAHWITPKHYAHCTVHIARRIWDALDGDRQNWMGGILEWPSIDESAFDVARTADNRGARITKALYDNARAVATATDVMNRYVKQERVQRRLGDQIRMIHHRYRWIDAKPPGQFAPEVREAFYAILDALEYRAAYDYMRSLSGDAYADLRVALDDLRR